MTEVVTPEPLSYLHPFFTTPTALLIMTELQTAMSILTCPNPALFLLTSPQTAMCPTVKTNTFYFILAQFTKVGQALLMFAKLHPALFGLFLVMIAAGLATIVVPVAYGFGASGPVAGEFLCPVYTSS